MKHTLIAAAVAATATLALAEEPAGVELLVDLSPQLAVQEFSAGEAPVAADAYVAAPVQAAPDPASGVVSAESVAEVTSVAKSRAKPPTAKSIVQKDIEDFCRENKITLGEVTPTGAIYLKGIERVMVPSDHPDFVRARALAFDMAYHRAVADYVLQKFGVESMKQFSTYFKNQSSDRLTPSADPKTTAERIVEKTDQLTEAQLDEGLRALGVTPVGSVVEKRQLAANVIANQSLRTAVGASAGLLPVQTFEGWAENNRYVIGVVIRGGGETETIAECLRRKMRPMLVRPDAGCSVEEAMPTEEELVSQFGVRLFFDRDGVPSLLSFGQWGSAYTGTDEDEAEDAMDHALIQAEAMANEQLTTFINSTVTIRDESVRGGGKTENVLFDANGVPTTEKIMAFVDSATKTSSLQGSDTLIGRSTVMRKVITHPASGRDLAVCVRLWSFGQYDAMKRIIEKKEPERPVVTPAPTQTPQGSSGKNRGRKYDF